MLNINKIRTSIALPYIQLVVECSLILFFVFYGFTHSSEVLRLVERLSILGLVVCISIYSLAHFLAIAATKSLFASFDESISYVLLLRIYFRRLPAKYLPGGIWHTVGRGADLIKTGISKDRVALVLSLEQLLAIWWSGFLGLALLNVARGVETKYFLVSALLGWTLIPPLLLMYISRRRGDGKLRVAAINFKISLIYIAGWACLATAFCAFLEIGDVVKGSVVGVAASYLVSWMIGALAIFAPQGIGIFEIIFNKTTSQFASQGTSLIWVAGSYRIVVLTADLIGWGLSFVWQSVERLTSKSRVSNECS
jgi:hypothetical protein